MLFRSPCRFVAIQIKASEWRTSRRACRWARRQFKATSSMFETQGIVSHLILESSDAAAVWTLRGASTLPLHADKRSGFDKAYGQGPRLRPACSINQRSDILHVAHGNSLAMRILHVSRPCASTTNRGGAEGIRALVEWKRGST